MPLRTRPRGASPDTSVLRVADGPSIAGRNPSCGFARCLRRLTAGGRVRNHCAIAACVPVTSREPGRGLRLLPGPNGGSSSLRTCPSHGPNTCVHVVAKLVFPEPKDSNTELAKGFVPLPVTFAVPPDLRSPERGTRLRHVAAVAASVPETAVRKHDYSRAWEVEVRTAGQIGVKGPALDPGTDKGETKNAFGRLIPLATDRAHRVRTRSGHALEHAVRQLPPQCRFHVTRPRRRTHRWPS